MVDLGNSAPSTLICIVFPLLIGRGFPSASFFSPGWLPLNVAVSISVPLSSPTHLPSVRTWAQRPVASAAGHATQGCPGMEGGPSGWVLGGSVPESLSWGGWSGNPVKIEEPCKKEKKRESDSLEPR